MTTESSPQQNIRNTVWARQLQRFPKISRQRLVIGKACLYAKSIWERQNQSILKSAINSSEIRKDSLQIHFALQQLHDFSGAVYN